jgi:transposase
MLSIGIDVSKLCLDWAVHGELQVRREANDRRGVAQLVREAACLHPDRVVIESTGGYERRLLQALAQAGLPAVVINPWRVRRFGEGLGVLAKTDPIDARLLAHFGAVANLALTPVRQGRRRLCADLLARRRQILGMIVAEKNRLPMAARALRRETAGLIQILERRLSRLDRQIDLLLAKDPERIFVAQILRSAPCVGPAIARTLLVDLPELGALSRRRIASLVGVAPFARDSGQRRGVRHTRGGRACVRTALYLAALTGARFNPVLRALYQRLITLLARLKPAAVSCSGLLYGRLETRPRPTWALRSLAQQPTREGAQQTHLCRTECPAKRRGSEVFPHTRTLRDGQRRPRPRSPTRRSGRPAQPQVRTASSSTA